MSALVAPQSQPTSDRGGGADVLALGDGCSAPHASQKWSAGPTASPHAAHAYAVELLTTTPWPAWVRKATVEVAFRAQAGREGGGGDAYGSSPYARRAEEVGEIDELDALAGAT